MRRVPLVVLTHGSRVPPYFSSVRHSRVPFRGRGLAVNRESMAMVTTSSNAGMFTGPAIFSSAKNGHFGSRVHSCHSRRPRTGTSRWWTPKPARWSSS